MGRQRMVRHVGNVQTLRHGMCFIEEILEKHRSSFSFTRCCCAAEALSCCGGILFCTARCCHSFDHDMMVTIKKKARIRRHYVILILDPQVQYY